MAATFDKAKTQAAPAKTQAPAPAGAGRAAKVNNPAIASMAARAHVNPGQLGAALLWVVSHHDTSDPDHPDHLKTMQSVAKVAPDFHAENAKQLLAGTYAPSAGGAHDAQAHGDKHAPPTPVPDGILSSQIHQLAAGSKGMDRGGLAILENGDPHLAMAADPSQRVHGWFDVVLHGTDVGEVGDGFRVIVRNPATGVPKVYMLTAAKLASIIRDSNWRSGMPIRLFACRAGRMMPGGKTAAAELSAALKTEVLASNQVNVDTARGFAAYPLEKDQGTQYNVHSQAGSSLKLNKGMTPDIIAQGKGAASSGTSGSTHGALVVPQLANEQPALLAQYQQRVAQLEKISPADAARVRSGMRAAQSWPQVHQQWNAISKAVRTQVDSALGIAPSGKR
jgi:hypothetical protein